MTRATPRWLAPGLALLGLLAPIASFSAVVEERTFHYSPADFALREAGGFHQLQVARGMGEAAPGWPDLPAVPEAVELPSSQEVERVEVVEARWRPWTRAHLMPAQRPAPSFGSPEWTGPDAAAYDRSGWLPEQTVSLGSQGWMRGTHLAHLLVRPARWSPSSGALETLEEVRVRLVMRPTRTTPVPRERVVPEWEDGLSRPRGPTRSAALGLDAAGPGRRAEPFKATQIPSLLGSPVAYLIITNDALAAEFQRLADWKTESGVPAVVRTTSFIEQQYPLGSDQAERIRMFIRDAYQRWGTKWVLLGGDVGVVPTRYAWTTFYGGESIATDLYYSCLDGNWNADGDSLYGEGFRIASDPGDQADLYPEVYVGRASVVTTADAQLFIDHSFQYARTPVGDYEHKALWFAEVLFPQNWKPGDYISQDGAVYAEENLPYFCGNPFWQVDRLYENYTAPAYVSPCYGAPQQETVQAVGAAMNAGVNFASHIGHGYRNTMSVGNGSLDNGYAQGMTNGNRLMCLYAANCTSNAIDFESIGEAFMLAQGGGAIANIGSTRFDFPIAGHLFEKEFCKLVFQDSVSALGEAQARQKIPFVSGSAGDFTYRWTEMTLLLLGDPELRLWTGAPRTLAVTHAASMPLGDSAFAVHVETGGLPLYNARVTLYKPDDQYVIGTTNGAGDAVLSFRPDSIGPFKVTVTAYDARPYQAEVPVTPGGAAVLADLPVVLDDGAVPPASGNNNGVVDAGEVVAVRVPLVNRGGSTATGVTGTLSTPDAQVTVTAADATYGSLAPAAVSSGTSYVVDFPYTLEDQREVPFRLDVWDAQGRHFVKQLAITVRAPELRHLAHGVVDVPGDDDGVIEPGETIHYTVQLRNLGTGVAQGVIARLRAPDGGATVTDSSAVFGNIAPGAIGNGDEFVFSVGSTSALLQLEIFDLYGSLGKQSVDVVRPSTPVDLLGFGAASSIALNWGHVATPDLSGYNIYRASGPAGPYVKVNPNPTGRTSYYLDAGLVPLTRYYYYVTAVDSSANESSPSLIDSTSTNPPMHAGWPVPMGRTTPSSVAVGQIYPDAPGLDIVAGANVLFVWHADASYPVDADESSRTSGDFTTRGSYYAAGPSIGDLDRDGVVEIVAPSWDSLMVYVFEPDGSVRAGFPAPIGQSCFSSAALGDLDNDGTLEMVLGSNGNQVLALRADGQEWRDGDSNPATFGVFKIVGQPFNYGTPALADIDEDGSLDIVYGSYDRLLYAWRSDGSNVPGFPRDLGASITCSPAVGDLDNDGHLEIVTVSGRDSLWVFRNGGARVWGKYFKVTGTTRQPSPALADMDGDGFLDIVAASTDGTLKVFDRNGDVLPGWQNVRYSLINGYASESSPVVADITGDGIPDVVMGGEDSRIHLFSGTGAELAGSPIQLGGEVRGTPTLCDCDEDGLSEIVLADWDKNLYMWDFPGAFSPGQIPPWPTFHHDERRTGRKSAPVFVGVEPGQEGRPSRALDLGPPRPNPALGATRFSYAIPADGVGQELELAIFDLAGRRVALLAKGKARAGRFEARWDLRGGNGEAVQAGVYFARLRLGAHGATRKLVVVR